MSQDVADSGGPAFMQLEGYHARYSTNGAGRTAATTSHIVGDVTKKTLCGRKADDWRAIGWHLPDCRLCRAKAVAILMARRSPTPSKPEEPDTP